MNENTNTQARTALARAFGVDWTGLDTESKRLVLADFVDAVEEDGCSEHEYQRRIGTGNLSSYVDCLKAGERNRQRHAV